MGEFVLGYLAHIKQRPQIRPEIILVFLSPIAELLCSLLDQFAKFILPEQHYYLAKDSNELVNKSTRGVTRHKALILSKNYAANVGGKLSLLVTQDRQKHTILPDFKEESDNILRLMCFSSGGKQYGPNTVTIHSTESLEPNLVDTLRTEVITEEGCKHILASLDQHDISNWDWRGVPREENHAPSQNTLPQKFIEDWDRIDVDGKFIGNIAKYRTIRDSFDVWRARHHPHDSRPIADRRFIIDIEAIGVVKQGRERKYNVYILPDPKH